MRLRRKERPTTPLLVVIEPGAVSNKQWTTPDGTQYTSHKPGWVCIVRRSHPVVFDLGEGETYEECLFVATKIVAEIRARET